MPTHSNIPIRDNDPNKHEQVNDLLFILMICILVLLVVMFSSCTAQAYTLDQWANAIYKAENSHTHPYGIMVKYQHTSPRQACKNTVRHQYRNWAKEGHPGAFLGYLAKRYAPVGCNTDNGTNKYWAKNVRWYLEKGLT